MARFRRPASSRTTTCWPSSPTSARPTRRRPVPDPNGCGGPARSGSCTPSGYCSRRCLTMEYLVSMTTRVPDGTPEEAVQDIRAREAAHSRELAAQGHLLRLWRPPLQPGEWRTLGLFAAAGGDRLEEVLASMPLRVWRTDEVTDRKSTRLNSSHVEISYA